MNDFKLVIDFLYRLLLQIWSLMTSNFILSFVLATGILGSILSVLILVKSGNDK